MSHKHYRCALCRNDLGFGCDQPRLCDRCAELVMPLEVWETSRRNAYAQGYAAAVFYSTCRILAERSHAAAPPRGADELDRWIAAWLNPEPPH